MALTRLLETIATLRERCPWMGQIDADSLLPYLHEETQELAEAISEKHDDARLQSELGDVLLQVVLHAQLATEREGFTFADVARGITEKMVRRNPHVFAPDGSVLPEPQVRPSIDEIEQTWQRIKEQERAHQQPIPADP